MFDKITIERELKQMLALDFNCNADDFDKKENVIVVPKELPGRREYTPEKPFFSMVTMGRNVVMNAPEELHEWLRKWGIGREGIWLFEHHNLMALESELAKYGKNLWQSHHMFLPKARMEDVDTDVEMQAVNNALKIQWFEQKDIQPLYGRPEFPNALCDCFKPERPDVLAVGVMYEGQIIGLAGCSADTKLFWQIGIDVMPESKGMNLGPFITILLKREILKRGKVPYYGTVESHIQSQKVAVKSGFVPYWAEINSAPLPAEVDEDI